MGLISFWYCVILQISSIIYSSTEQHFWGILFLIQHLYLKTCSLSHSPNSLPNVLFFAVQHSLHKMGILSWSKSDRPWGNKIPIVSYYGSSHEDKHLRKANTTQANSASIPVLKSKEIISQSMVNIAFLPVCQRFHCHTINLAWSPALESCTLSTCCLYTLLQKIAIIGCRQVSQAALFQVTNTPTLHSNNAACRDCRHSPQLLEKLLTARLWHNTHKKYIPSRQTEAKFEADDV